METAAEADREKTPPTPAARIRGGNVLEMGVPGHFLFVGQVLVFLLYGSGDSLHVNQGAGVVVREDALAREEAGEVVDAFSGEGGWW